MASNGQYSEQSPQFIQTSMSMKNSSGNGTGLPSGLAAGWVIQMHCGGQTFAQMLHDVQQRTFPSASVVHEHRQDAEPLVDHGSRSSGYSTVNSPSVRASWRTIGSSPQLLLAEPEVGRLVSAPAPLQRPAPADEERAEKPPERDPVSDDQSLAEAHSNGLERNGQRSRRRASRVQAAAPGEVEPPPTQCRRIPRILSTRSIVIFGPVDVDRLRGQFQGTARGSRSSRHRR